MPSTQAWWSIFLAGFAWSLLMAWRSQIGGDQAMMLHLGWPLVDQGQWLPYGMPTSAGGRSPGGFMSLLMALPLWVWPDYRAPAVFLALVHAAAFLWLRRWLRPALTPAGDWCLLILVWCNPWRLYFSAHLWNANFMFVAAVLHLGLLQRMRDKDALATAAMCVLIALTMQIHTSAMILAIATVLMFWRGFIQVHWGGFVLGTVLAIGSYVPWLLAILQQPELKPGDKGFFLRGLVYVFPLLRGVLYWLKMSSLSLASRMINADFLDLPATYNQLLKPLAIAIGSVAHVTLWFAIRAQWRFFKRQWCWWRHHWRQSMATRRARPWVYRYIVLMAAAALLSFAMSPTTVMFWQAFIVLPASALILILWTQAALQTRHAVHVRRVAQGWLVLSAVLLVIQTFGAPHYRCLPAHSADGDATLTALHVTQVCYSSE